MALLKLDVFNLRNIQSASITLSPQLNLITGANASGKSSLLEAVFILGRARSFRTTHIKQAIAFEQAQLIVSAQSRSYNGSLSSIGIQIDGKQCEIRIDQESRHKADLAYALPIQLIQPKSYRLLDGAPQLRREFLDWGIFNQNRNFLGDWRKFSKALQQRNALLKQRQVKQISAWDKELLSYGQVVNEFRQDYLLSLRPVFMEMASHFLDCADIELKFVCGWDDKHSLAEILKTELEKDLRFGFTHSGPHRADFQVFLKKKSAKDFLSRGQQKLLVLALMLAQVKLLIETTQNSCCILVDDLCAELDTLNRVKLLKYLSLSGCQVLLTATELSDFGDLQDLTDFKMFHVEHGRVTGLDSN